MNRIGVFILIILSSCGKKEAAEKNRIEDKDSLVQNIEIHTQE